MGVARGSMMLKGRMELMTAEGDPAVRRDFDRFVAEGRSQWVRVATSILRDPAEAEDVVQDTLIGVWRNWNSLGNPQGYVSRAVAVNARKRRARRRMHTPLDAIGPFETPARSEPPDAVELERAIADLPPAQQATLRAKFYLGMTFRQIGKSMSISSNTAASRCRYALASLRRILSRGK